MFVYWSLTGQLRRSPMLAFRNSSPNMLGVAFSLDSNIFTAWLLRRRRIVCVCHYKEATAPPNCGVPQGSLLEHICPDLLRSQITRAKLRMQTNKKLLMLFINWACYGWSTEIACVCMMIQMLKWHGPPYWNKDFACAVIMESLGEHVRKTTLEDVSDSVRWNNPDARNPMLQGGIP